MRWKSVSLDGGSAMLPARIWTLRGAEKRTGGPYRLSTGHQNSTLGGAALLARSLLAGFGFPGDRISVHDAFGVECYIVEAEGGEE
jgi:hypothetical protein